MYQYKIVNELTILVFVCHLLNDTLSNFKNAFLHLNVFFQVIHKTEISLSRREGLYISNILKKHL